MLVHLMEGDVDNLITDAQGLGFLPHDLEQNTRKELFKVFCCGGVNAVVPGVQ